MSEEELQRLQLPKYSRGEEVFNLVTHIVGGSFGIIVLFYIFILGLMEKISFLNFFAIFIFSIMCILVYTISSIYHGLRPYRFSKHVMRVIDHCDIYGLIAGTYTPVCLIGLWGSKWCWIILGLEWLFALIGIIMNAIDLNNTFVKIVSMVLYILGGWLVILFPPAVKLLPFNAFLFILLGGVVYTLGSILYGIGAKRKWFHSIFHIFCLLGTIIQFIGILFLLN